MDRLKTELGSGHRDQTEQLLRDMDALRQRRHTTSKYLRQAMDEKDELLLKLTSLQQERLDWVRERLELEDRLHHLQILVIPTRQVLSLQGTKIQATQPEFTQTVFRLRNEILGNYCTMPIIACVFWTWQYLSACQQEPNIFVSRFT